MSEYQELDEKIFMAAMDIGYYQAYEDFCDKYNNKRGITKIDLRKLIKDSTNVAPIRKLGGPGTAVGVEGIPAPNDLVIVKKSTGLLEVKCKIEPYLFDMHTLYAYGKKFLDPSFHLLYPRPQPLDGEEFLNAVVFFKKWHAALSVQLSS